MNPDARILVVVTEILLNRLLHTEGFDFSRVSAVVMDEFHSFADLERVIQWSLKSDRTAAIDAMSELLGADIRNELAKIKSPTLVMVTWIGYKPYGATHDAIDATARAQYAKLSGVRIAISDNARHFIMYDDPDWMFAQIDPFLAPAKAVAAQ